MVKITPTITDAVADTLFITVYMRAKDVMQKHPILNDQQSLKLMKQIDYPFDKYSGATLMSRIGVCVRIKYIDSQLESFIGNNENVVVVNIGCGLDDRYGRIKNASKATFYELDLPETIQLRKQLLPEQSNQFFIAGSAFNKDWMDRLKEKHPGAHFLFIAEGVLMYFDELVIKDFFHNLAERFPESSILFDGITSFLSHQSSKHDTVKNSDTSFHWGFDDDRIFEKWHSNLHYENTFYTMHGMRKYSVLSYFLSLLPIFGKSAKIVSLKIQGK